MSESYERWSEQNRISQQHWDSATANLHSSGSGSGGFSSGPATISFGGGGGGGGSYAGGGSGIGLFDLLRGIVVFAAGVVAWPVLYCVPVAVAFAATGLANGMLEGAVDPSSSSGVTGVVVATMVVAVILVVALSRLDHRAARSKLWWVPRHVVRLAVIAGLGHLLAASLLVPSARLQADSLPGRALLAQPVYLACLAALVVVVHVVLTRKSLRTWWHYRLERLRLRAA